MAVNSLLDRILKLPPPVVGKTECPPPELVGFIIMWQRSLRHLKKATLASMAGVSLSTLERVERGEKVAIESLDRIGIALGHDAGYFTSPREPLSQCDAAQQFVDTYKHTVAVKVRPLRTHSQVRALARCHCYMPYAPEETEEHKEGARELAEWFDLAAFLTGRQHSYQSHEDSPRRKLYDDILSCAARIERGGSNILTGVMDAPQTNVPDWKVGVISITSKSRDPGGLKRRVILVDRRCVDLRLPYEGAVARGVN